MGNLKFFLVWFFIGILVGGQPAFIVVAGISSVLQIPKNSPGQGWMLASAALLWVLFLLWRGIKKGFGPKMIDPEREGRYTMGMR